MTRRDLAWYFALPLAAALVAALLIAIVTGHASAAPRSGPEPIVPLAAQAPSTGQHAPSRFHRVYPEATQHARDWLWRGLGDTQFACLDALWHYESGWRVKAGNPDGSYGIPQAYPGRKMASFGADWRTSAMTQVRWGLHYVRARYGSPCGAWAVWQKQGWY